MFQNLLPASILQKKTFRNRSKGLWKLSASAIFTNLIGASCRQWYIVWSNLIPDECNKNCQMLKNCISYSYCPAWVLTRGHYNHHQKAIQLLEYQMVRALCRFDTLGNLVSAHQWHVRTAVLWCITGARCVSALPEGGGSSSLGRRFWP